MANEDDMYKIDYSMTAPLIATYIGIMTLVFVNLFIALLSATFSSVHDQAEEYLFFQRGTEILNTEILSKQFNTIWSKVEYNPYQDEKYIEKKISIDDRISNLEQKMIEQMNILVYL